MLLCYRNKTCSALYGIHTSLSGALLVWFLNLTRISIIVDTTHKFLDKITHDIGQRKLRFWSIRLYSQQSLTLDSGHIEYGPTWDEGVGCRHNETCFRVLNSTILNTYSLHLNQILEPRHQVFEVLLKFCWNDFELWWGEGCTSIPCLPFTMTV